MFRVFVALLLLSIQASSAARIKKRTVPTYPQTSAVISAKDGKLISGVNAHLSIVPASITKVMTLYLLFEAMDQGRFGLASPLRVSSVAANQLPSKIWLKPGQTISVQDAIYALVVNSANDVACVVAENIAGSVANFADLMNRKARSLGMYRTTFYNASGLPHKLQRTTAYDLALLSRAVWKDYPRYYRFFSTPKWRGHRNHNRLLGRYPGLDGLKTGYTAAGYNLAASAVQNGQRIFAVVIGHRSSTDRTVKMEKLLSTTFAKLGRGATLDDAYELAQSNPLSSPMPAPETPQLAVANDAKRQSPFSIPMTAFIDPESVNPSPGILPPPMPDAVEAIAVDPKKRWSIQVGAYQTMGRAKEVGDLAQLTAKRYLEGLSADYSPIETNTGTLYRCRFNKLEHLSARSTCQVLRQKGLPCLVVSQF